MNYSLPFGVLGVITAVLVLASLSNVDLIPIEFSLVSNSIIELRDNPDEPKGISLTVSDLRIHHYMIGIIIILATFAVIHFIRSKTLKKRLIPLSTFFIGFGGFLIVDQLPNIVTGIWDRPIF